MKKENFVKNGAPDEIKHELLGLKLLEEKFKESSIQTPKILQVKNKCFVMERINATGGGDYFAFGRDLAIANQATVDYCGFEHNNYIGKSRQLNQISNNWGDFFWSYRLTPQVSWSKNQLILESFKKINCKLLIEFLNQHQPKMTLVHGDLWSGNHLFDGKHFYLIDPAIYYGDPLVDLAMTEMFGGFPDDFYKGYWSVTDNIENYPSLRLIYNLYHKLNHFNLFGGAYLAGCLDDLEFLVRKFN